jgi:hypothetical protein
MQRHISFLSTSRRVQTRSLSLDIHQILKVLTYVNPWDNRWNWCIYSTVCEDGNRHHRTSLPFTLISPVLLDFYQLNIMKFSFALSLGLLALPTSISAGPLVPRNTDLIDDTTFNTIKFLEQYAAAAYCSENFQGTVGRPLSCKAGNCKDVQNDVTEIVNSFFK